MTIKEKLIVGAIQLDEVFYLKSDTDNWTLIYVKESPKENGNPGEITTSRQISYHGNLLQALKEYLSTSLKVSKTVEDLTTLLELKFNNLKTLIENEDIKRFR